MGKKPQENPQLDMTPMIDVVFELIIFFVVTLVEAQKKDESIELEDGKHGIVLVPEELPPTHPATVGPGMWIVVGILLTYRLLWALVFAIGAKRDLARHPGACAERPQK